jgi:hypothetical protein
MQARLIRTPASLSRVARGLERFVEEALSRLADRRLSRDEQATIVRATRHSDQSAMAGLVEGEAVAVSHDHSHLRPSPD